MARLIALLLLTSCYHMKNARFVDESDTNGHTKVWICVEEDGTEPTNIAGIMCADMVTVMSSK